MERFWTTLAIWIMISGVSIAMTVGRDHVADMAYVTIIVLVIVGTVMTMGVWDQLNDEKRSDEKAKRGSSDAEARLQLLMALLSDEERSAVRDRLMDNGGGDGEIIGLDAVLHDDVTRRR